MPTITAVDLYNFTQCAHRVYLDEHGDPALKGEVSKFVQLLWEKGLQTERDYIARLGYDTVEDLQAFSTKEAATRTLALMSKGARLIYQGVLISGDQVGRPDLLIRHDDDSSNFGAWYYEPVDIKAGKGWDERDGKRTKFKEHYAFQILFYHDLITSIQGTPPRLCRIVNVEGEFEEFDRADLQLSYAAALAEVRRLVAGEETSEPVLGSHCQQCGWFKKCKRWVEETHDPTGLFYVGTQKLAFNAAGLRTVDDIAVINVPDYLKPPLKIKGLAEKSLMRMKRRAQVLLAGQPEVRPGYALPDVPTEIYFDIEDDPTQGTTYLFGMWIRRAGGAGAFEYILAERPEDEKVACQRFWDFVAAQDECVFYVYSPKERTSLRHLMKRHGLDEDVFEHYVAREFDLYHDLVEKYSDWPTYSYGIKHIARLIGFSWRDSDPGGANSIAWYNDYLGAADPAVRARVLRRILEYNEDDCRAMAHIVEWFRGRASWTEKL